MKRSLFKTGAALFAATLCATGRAADTVWNGGDGDWVTNDNWSNGAPTAEQSADLNKGGAINFGSTAQSVSHISSVNTKKDAPIVLKADDANGGLSITSTGEWDIGRDVTQGHVVFDSGTYSIAGYPYVGWWWHNSSTACTGKVEVVNASVTFDHEIKLGIDHGYGEVEVKGGSLTVNADLRVGSDWGGARGVGVYRQSGGETRVNYAGIGYAGNGEGYAEVSAGNLTSAGRIDIGHGAGSYGELNISGGYVVATDGELRICEGTSSTGMVYVTGGALVNSQSGWFCIGRAQGCRAYLEVDGGAVSNLVQNMTIGTLGGDNTGAHSEVAVKSGELYTVGTLYVGEQDSAKATVWGGRVYADDHIKIASDLNDGEAAELIVKGGTVETYYVNVGAKGTLNIRGGEFKATKSTSTGFFRLTEGGAIKVEHKGLTVDTGSYDITIPVTLSGLGGLVKKGTGKLTISATCDLKGAITVQEGTLVYNGETYTAGQSIAATYTLATAATATWTNALEDGDLADPANWICCDASGEVIEGGVPDSATVVTVPYALAVNSTSESPYATCHPDISAFTGYASVVVGVSGTVAPRGAWTVPDIVKSAIAWYDFADEATVTANESHEATAVANKGTLGATLDAAAFSENARALYGTTNYNGRAVLYLPVRTGLVTPENAGLGNVKGDADRTLVALSICEHGVHYWESESKYHSEMYTLGISAGWYQTDYFRMSQYWGGGKLAYIDGTEAYDDNGETKTRNKGAELGGLSEAGDKWTIWTMESANVDGTITVSGSQYFNGALTEAASATSAGLATPEKARLYIGVKAEHGTPSAGKIAETMLFDKALSDDELATVRSYLSSKWFTTPEVDMDETFTGKGIALADGATLNFGGGDWTLGSVAVAAGGGTIANVGSLTVTGTITITVNSDGTIGGLAVDGDLTLGADAVLNIVGAQYLTDEAVVAIRAAGVTGEFTSVTTDGKVARVVYGTGDDAGKIRVSKKGGLVIIVR